MTDLVLRIEQHIKRCEYKLIEGASHAVAGKYFLAALAQPVLLQDC